MARKRITIDDPRPKQPAPERTSTIPDVLCGYFSLDFGTLNERKSPAGEDFDILKRLNRSSISLLDLLKIADRKGWYVSFKKVPEDLRCIGFPGRDVSAIMTLDKEITPGKSIALIEGLLPSYFGGSRYHSIERKTLSSY